MITTVGRVASRQSTNSARGTESPHPWLKSTEQGFGGERERGHYLPQPHQTGPGPNRHRLVDAEVGMATRRTQPGQISVVLLSYNRLGQLRRALTSVLGQSICPHEIIVVDNFSPTSSHIRQYVARVGGVRLLTPDRNLGFTGGMNVGIAHAT